MSRRELNRQEKRRRIIEAALRVFSRAGYTDASMDDIATEAGLTKPTLYNHFDNKEALFDAMMASQGDTMLLAFGTEPDGHMVDRLLNFAWRYADIVMRPEFLALARLTIGAAHRLPHIGRQYQQSGPDKVLAGLKAFFEDQRELGCLRFDDAELAAEDFWGLILSAPRNRALHIPDVAFDRAALARYLNNGIATFLRAYSTDPAGDLAQLANAAPWYLKNSDPPYDKSAP